MPMHLPPLSRRAFLRSALTAGTALALKPALFAADRTVDPNLVAFISDTHIDADPDKIVRTANMTGNLKTAVNEVVALSQRPAFTVVNGDCAYLKGEAADYANFGKLLDPIREAQIPIHLTLGNHDDREAIRAGVKDVVDLDSPVEKKRVAMVALPRANLFLLDTLEKTNATPGHLGDQQIEWLAKALDEHKDKPAVIVGHHHLEDGARPGGVKDTKRLLEVLVPRAQVKAYIYGHTHTWHRKEHEGIHLINLPPTGYVFTPGHPHGWVQAQFQESGAHLQLSCLEKKHKANGEEVNLKWRS